MRFGLLGPLQVTADDRPLQLGQPRQRAILARLLVDANRVVPVDRLVDDVWGEGRPNRSAGSAHAYISNLRRVLEPHRQSRGVATVLVSEAPGYVLRARAEDVDALWFEHLAHEGHRLSEADPALALAAFDEALGLWRGPALDDFADEPWRVGFAVRLEELRAGMLEGRFTAMLDLGRHVQAIPDLVAATTAEPLRERLWELLMVALYRNGRQADALAAYQQVRAILGEELGIDPGPALADIERRVLQQDPELAGPLGPRPVQPVVAAAAEGRRPVGSRLVGRDAAVAILVGAIESAETKHGAAVVVSGPSGIGKTRLVEHATGAAGKVVWARCVEGGTAPALWPWLQIAAGLGAEGTALADALSARRQIGLDVGARDELYEAIVDAVKGAAVRPLTIVIDDAQWSDAASLQAASLLLSAMGELSILLVLLVRDDGAMSTELLSMIEAVGRMRNGYRIHLEGLDEESVRDQLTMTFGSFPSDASVRWLHDRTSGNPFFLIETIRQLSDVGALEDLASMRRLVPPTVVEFVTARIGRLPASAREVLTAGAVLGREFDQRIVAGLVGIDRDHCFDALEMAMVGGLIVEGSTPTRARFRHDLVREAIYHRLNSVARTRLHARAAVHLDAILHGGRAHTNEVASHAWRGRGAMPAAEVIKHLKRAAVDNVQAGAYEAADSWLDRALSIADDVAEDAARLQASTEILLQLLRIRSVTKGYGSTDTVQAVEHASQLQERGLLHDDGALLAELASYASSAGELRTAGRLAATVVDIARRTGDHPVEVTGRFRQAVTAYQLGDVARAVSEMKDTAALAQHVMDDPDGGPTKVNLPGILMWLAMMLRVFGEREKSLAVQGDASRLMASTHDPGIRVAVAMVDIWLAVLDRDDGLALARSEHYYRIAEEVGLSLADPEADLGSGWALARSGDLEGGLARVRRGAAAQAAVGAHGLVLRATAVEGDILVRMGSLDVALELIERTLAVCAITGEALWLPELHRVRADVYERQHRFTDADAELQRASGIAAEHQSRLFGQWAHIDLERLRLERSHSKVSGPSSRRA